MSPSKARHIARHSCWFKAARTIESATAKLAERLADGEEQGSVYRCRFSAPNEAPHYHLSTNARPTPSAHVAEAIAVLGAAAYRVDDSEVRADAE